MDRQVSGEWVGAAEGEDRSGLEKDGPHCAGFMGCRACYERQQGRETCHTHEPKVQGHVPIRKAVANSAALLSRTCLSEIKGKKQNGMAGGEITASRSRNRVIVPATKASKNNAKSRVHTCTCC